MTTLDSIKTVSRAPAYPLLFLTTYVFWTFIGMPVPPEVLARPLAIAAVIAVGMTTALGAVVRNRHLGAHIALLVVGALASPLLAVMLMALATGPQLLLAFRHRTSADWASSGQMLNLMCTALLGFAVLTALGSGALRPWGTELRAVEARPAAADLPDIYLILLDGYPRADTLRTQFGIDSAPFMGQMERLGFTAAKHSHSNYNATPLTLASLVHGKQVPVLVPHPPAAPVDQWRAVANAFNSGGAVEAAREAGYEFVVIAPPFTQTRIGRADRVLDPTKISDFEWALLQGGSLPVMSAPLQRGPLLDQRRSGLLESFELLGHLAAERASRPKLVLAHVMLPHPPYLFTADGDRVEPFPCFPAGCSLMDGGQRYGDEVIRQAAAQITYLNDLVAAAAADIQDASDQPPVIVIFSDHGHRLDLADTTEMLRNLTLSATPGAPGVLPDDITPVTIIPRLLRAYAGVTMPISSEESYLVDVGRARTSALFPLTPAHVSEGAASPTAGKRPAAILRLP